MARIPTYQKDIYISDLDRIIGTDGDTNELVTKNFFLGDIAEYVIDKFIDPDAVSFTIPVLRDTQDTLGSNATRITGSIIKQDSYPTGSLITIAGDLTLERDQSDTTLTLISDGSNPTPAGEQHNPSIKFIQDGGAQNAAVGFNIIDDTAGGTLPGTGNRFWIVNAMDDAIGEGGITFGTAQVDGWDNAIGRFIIRGDGKGLFGHPNANYTKTLDSQFEIYDDRTENTTSDYSLSVLGVADTSDPGGTGGAGGIISRLSLVNGGTPISSHAIGMVTGTTSSEILATGDLAFYVGSDMDTSSATGFAGVIHDSGNWQIGGTTSGDADPGYQLKVAGTGLFTDQVTIPETPVAGTDAASKAYVDSENAGQVTGTGTNNTLTKWTGPTTLGNSIVSESGVSLNVAGNNAKIVLGNTNEANTTNSIEGIGESGKTFIKFGNNNNDGGDEYQRISLGYNGGGGAYIFLSANVEEQNNPADGIKDGSISIGSSTTNFVMDDIYLNAFETRASGKLLVLGTGQSSFAGQITIPATPVAATDAASKAYVDSQNTGSGVTQTTGTYTPQLIASVPSEWVISSYNIQQGKWVRTGNMVFCDFWITINASNISGNTSGTSGLTVQGWPYDHDGGAGSFQGGALNQCDGFDVQSAGTNTTLNSGLGNAKLNILKQNTAITNYFVTQHMQTGDLNNGNQIYIIGSFSYLTTDAATLNPGATIDS